MKKVLLMHISSISGHRSASLAIEQALQEIDKDVQVQSIDALNYTNPFLEKLTYKIYIFIIKAVPQVWDYLYDNEYVMRRVRRIRALIHRINNRKIKQLFDRYKPDIVVCTQAFPCGMVADYKRRHKLNIPLMGVLTDYAPHSYWLNDLVDVYIVPHQKIEQRLMKRGLPAKRLKAFGIPINPKFRNSSNRKEVFGRLGLDPGLATILVMGGGQGLGPIKKIVRSLDTLSLSLQLIIVCGTNKRLYKWLRKNKPFFNKPVSAIGYTKDINALMEISSVIVTKPGGLTSTEALSKSLPIIIVSPLPGQESYNTRFLLENKLALKVNNFVELCSLAEDLLSNPARLSKLRSQAAEFGRADSALRIAQLILDIVKSPKR